MAFPATYNITYYKGDTYEFVIKPKTSNGQVFPIPSTLYTANFNIADSRGESSTQRITASAAITVVAHSVTNKALTDNVATLTTLDDHNFIPGEAITVSSVDSTFNGTYIVKTVPTSKTFTYDKTHANIESAVVTPNGSVISTLTTSTDSITCMITPIQGGDMTNSSYVYDVSISRIDNPSITYTVLTGNITVIDSIAPKV